MASPRTRGAGGGTHAGRALRAEQRAAATGERGKQHGCSRPVASPSNSRTSVREIQSRVMQLALLARHPSRAPGPTPTPLSRPCSCMLPGCLGALPRESGRVPPGGSPAPQPMAQQKRAVPQGRVAPQPMSAATRLRGSLRPVACGCRSPPRPNPPRLFVRTDSEKKRKRIQKRGSRVFT
jgi:hypothetical protein